MILPTLSPQSVATGIAAVESLDLATTTIDEIFDVLTPEFIGYQAIAPRIEPGLKLLRARVCPKPSNIRDLLYPPPERTPLGRANREGQPLLYCCTSKEAAFFEVRPKVGQHVVLGRWVTTSTLFVN